MAELRYLIIGIFVAEVNDLELDATHMEVVVLAQVASSGLALVASASANPLGGSRRMHVLDKDTINITLQCLNIAKSICKVSTKSMIKTDGRPSSQPVVLQSVISMRRH